MSADNDVVLNACPLTCLEVLHETSPERNNI